MIAVIHYAYGAPTSVDNLVDYFGHMLKGKPVPAPMLEKISESFKKPGFPDFIASATQRIANGLELLLNERLDEKVKVYNAYKHTAPFPKDAFEQAIADGATTIVTLPINPIHSNSGGGAIHTEIAEYIGDANIRHIALNEWNTDEGIVAVYADRVRRAMHWLPVAAQENAHVLFTVHSQPIDLERNASYVKQYEELTNAIAAKAGIENFHAVYRSGKKEGWLAPDVGNKIRELHANGATGFVTCEVLSLSADVESYFEIGPECQALCQELNVPFALSEFPADSFDTVMALANLVEKKL